MAIKSQKTPTSARKPKKISASKAAPVEKPKATNRKAKATKASASKVGAKLSLDPEFSGQEPVISHDEISTRAYFIAERRQQMGWDGDSETDWADAVAQLSAEALEKPLKKR